jgi:hypothetical protein
VFYLPGMARYTIQGQDVTTPVRIREAAVCSALFAVPARAAQRVIAYSGYRVAEPVPGRALCTLTFVRYADGDLGRYAEFGVTFAIRGWGVFVHWLPVDQGFTLEAGRTIWGFPKELADIELDLAGAAKRCTVFSGGKLVVDLTVRPGLPVPGAARSRVLTSTAYTYADDVRRRITWEVEPRGVRTRPGGVRLRLGDHPIADELRGLGLPRTALMSSTVDHAAMVFAAAEELGVRR